MENREVYSHGNLHADKIVCPMSGQRNGNNKLNRLLKVNKKKKQTCKSWWDRKPYNIILGLNPPMWVEE